MKSVSVALCAVILVCAGVLRVPVVSAATESVLYSFQGAPSDGTLPLATLINVGGTLYGTTINGGVGNYGTVFSLDLNTGMETVLYSFGGDKGADPYAGVNDVGGTLYGTTYEGGGSGCHREGCGTVFSLDLNTGTETVLHSFTGHRDGALAWAGVIDVKGTLYGTTMEHGTYGYGTVFSLDLKTGKEAVLHSFTGGSDGAFAVAGLIDVDGTLYGTTEVGGSGTDCSDTLGCGTVFSLDPQTGIETVLYSFCEETNCNDGAFPKTGVIQVKGILYGTTFEGGVDCSGGGCGTAYSFNLKTKKETMLHAFQGGSGDGAFPSDALIDVRGTLYGTTLYGGTGTCTYSNYSGCGTVFSVTP